VSSPGLSTSAILHLFGYFTSSNVTLLFHVDLTELPELPTVPEDRTLAVSPPLDSNDVVVVGLRSPDRLPLDLLNMTWLEEEVLVFSLLGSL
jgi:hypothetical protein